MPVNAVEKAGTPEAYPTFFNELLGQGLRISKCIVKNNLELRQISPLKKHLESIAFSRQQIPPISDVAVIHVDLDAEALIRG